MGMIVSMRVLGVAALMLGTLTQPGSAARILGYAMTSCLSHQLNVLRVRACCVSDQRLPDLKLDCKI